MGRLFVVGLGPGSPDTLTPQALSALEAADVIVGYKTYLALVDGLFPGTARQSFGMREERERCAQALRLAGAGQTVALVCGGDAGVYGMASPVLELAETYPQVEIQVVPGLTAALCGAAVLGAPLGHDFCVLSLSDLLTPWEVVEQRLKAAALGDYVVCLYNPASSKRRDHLRRACDELIAAGKSPRTWCGWVKNIGRPGQCSRILTLDSLRGESVDMFTTVFVGNRQTRRIADRLVTPRGYGQS